MCVFRGRGLFVCSGNGYLKGTGHRFAKKRKGRTEIQESGRFWCDIQKNGIFLSGEYDTMAVFLKGLV